MSGGGIVSLAVPSGLMAPFSEMALSVKTVKNGFIHFHSPVRKALSRSSSTPAMPVASAREDQDMFITDDCKFAAAAAANHGPATTDSRYDIEGENLDSATAALMAWAIRTPSTTCPSPRSHSPPTPRVPPPPPISVRVVAADKKEAAPGQSSRRAPPVPFMSLGLPAWAMEKAANAPRPTDFGECSSWYSASPRSSPAASPPGSPLASPSSSPLSSPRAPSYSLDFSSMEGDSYRGKVSWAELAEEEEEQDSWAAEELPGADVGEVSTIGDVSTASWSSDDENTCWKPKDLGSQGGDWPQGRSSPVDAAAALKQAAEAMASDWERGWCSDDDEWDDSCTSTPPVAIARPAGPDAMSSVCSRSSAPVRFPDGGPAQCSHRGASHLGLRPTGPQPNVAAIATLPSPVRGAALSGIPAPDGSAADLGPHPAQP
eukprot:CAMPEP_0204173198 /NCGR_PEP_ID=MMETSP0361-20130328/44776_1 /ASSEMBLY_ACC=CAM_ASM_000343 /TAXON_ID=268821 /ORGANISM="Scrippsiella Hangoei, Strain SHTV-5" /LENGTH=430 /DNA_ID=CAMNT_0051131433 /DNA_START=6 /DNA_END=1297 /DNA_ORIENTATION=-